MSAVLILREVLSLVVALPTLFNSCTSCSHSVAQDIQSDVVVIDQLVEVSSHTTTHSATHTVSSAPVLRQETKDK
jgi:hypothetical protein